MIYTYIVLNNPWYESEEIIFISNCKERVIDICTDKGSRLYVCKTNILDHNSVEELIINLYEEQYDDGEWNLRRLRKDELEKLLRDFA